MRKNLLWAAAWSAVLGVATLAAAAENVNHRSIERLGCYADRDWCFITISGAAVGPSDCASKSIRWDASTPAGKNAYATAALAFTHQISVDLQVGGCIAADAGDGRFPQLNWIAAQR